jgi:hypothetical protein
MADGHVHGTKQPVERRDLQHQAAARPQRLKEASQHRAIIFDVFEDIEHEYRVELLVE